MHPWTAGSFAPLTGHRETSGEHQRLTRFFKSHHQAVLPTAVNFWTGASLGAGQRVLVPPRHQQAQQHPHGGTL